MIRIQDHIALNLGSEGLEALVQDYLKRINGFSSFRAKQLLLKAIHDEEINGLKLESESKELELLIHLHEKFDHIICALPEELEACKDEISKKGLASVIYNGKSTTQFGKNLLELYGYDKHFRKSQNRGIWLARQLNLKACPYCNSQYTLTVLKKDNKHLAKFQFDHFYAKNQYPYLSLSFYNLIPSCASCNIRKSRSDFSYRAHYHPYHNSLSTFSKFHLDYPVSLNKLSYQGILNLKPNELSVKLKSKFSDADLVKRVKTHGDQFDIEGIYQQHWDLAQELLIKAKLYSGAGAEFLTKIEGLFPDKSMVLKYLLGNYMRENEILKRPLSKVTQDIAKQLGLIK